VFSIKSKTIILVLTIYFILSFIFFIIRYMDIRDFAQTSQEKELEKINKIYQTSLKRISKFYITRGYANINSYGIKDAFESHDSKALHALSLPRWNVITKENRYLKTFSFYDPEGNLLTYFGHDPGKKLLYVQQYRHSLSGFWYYHNAFDYHAVAAARRDADGTIVGYINFTLDPAYFLSEIKKLADIQAFGVFEKPDRSKMYFVLPQHPKIIDRVLRDDLPIRHHEIVFGNEVFLPYVIHGIGMDAHNHFKVIFLQNISHWKAVVRKALVQSLIALVLIALLTTLIIRYGFDIILKELNASNRRLQHSRNELKQLNENLQVKIHEAIEEKLTKEREANEKERILAHQSKLASMGEMIGNIAHQWRQPLTEISSILISLELYFEKGKLTAKKFHTNVKEANKQIAFMSKTVDDFRNFFASKKEKQPYAVAEMIERACSLVSASLKNNNIQLKIEIVDHYDVFGFPNEMAQAILNIISNAKDILLERQTEGALIHVKAFKKRDKKVVTIEDNAGGIHIIPMEKIFEPYFSTKHAKTGTGIGLYMTKTIIEKNNHGKIEVDNGLKGARFTIIF